MHACISRRSEYLSRLSHRLGCVRARDQVIFEQIRRKIPSAGTRADACRGTPGAAAAASAAADAGRNAATAAAAAASAGQVLITPFSTLSWLESGACSDSPEQNYE